MLHMTLQSAFDIVVRHARAQPKQSLSRGNAGDCVYRSPEGLKCFIGALIPDDKYHREMDYADGQFPIAKVLRYAGIAEHGLTMQAAQ